MENEDFIIEESSKKKISIIIFFILLFIIFFSVFIYYKNNYSFNIKKEIVLEAGTKLENEIEYYVTSKIIDKNDYTLSLNNINNTIVGEYSYKVKYKNITKSGIIKIVDTIPPKVTTKDVTIGVGEDYDLSEFISSCEEYSKPCNVSLRRDSDYEKNEKEGTYTIDLKISDLYGNTTSKSVKLVVKKNYNGKEQKEKDLAIDHTEPNIHGLSEADMIIKLNKAQSSDDIEDSEIYNELLSISSDDFHNYIDSLYYNNRIDDSQIISVYNKYNYIIGYAIKIKLDNGEELYLHKKY